MCPFFAHFRKRHARRARASRARRAASQVATIWVFLGSLANLASDVLFFCVFVIFRHFVIFWCARHCGFRRFVFFLFSFFGHFLNLSKSAKNSTFWDTFPSRIRHLFGVIFCHLADRAEPGRPGRLGRLGRPGRFALHATNALQTNALHTNALHTKYAARGCAVARLHRFYPQYYLVIYWSIFPHKKMD